MLKPGDTGYIITPWSGCKVTRTETTGGAPKCHNCGEPQRHPNHPTTRYVTLHRIYHQRYSSHIVKAVQVIGVGNGEYVCQRSGYDSHSDDAKWLDRIDFSNIYESEEAAQQAAGPDEPDGEEHLNCGRTTW